MPPSVEHTRRTLSFRFRRVFGVSGSVIIAADEIVAELLSGEVASAGLLSLLKDGKADESTVVAFAFARREETEQGRDALRCM